MSSSFVGRLKKIIKTNKQTNKQTKNPIPYQFKCMQIILSKQTLIGIESNDLQELRIESKSF